MSAPGGGQEDFCEYVFNPLMRQYQAMMRLLQILRDSQSADCNDMQCFESNGSLANFNGASTNSLLSTYGPMLFIWALFVFALFMFRPTSMRRSSKENTKNAASLTNHNIRNTNGHDDDDDNLIN